MASHWAVKIVEVIACAIGFGVLGVGIGFLAAAIGFETGVLGGGFGAFEELFVSMSVFGILGAAFGGYFGNKIIRSKFK